MRKKDCRQRLFPALEELQSGPNPIGLHSKSKQAVRISARSQRRTAFKTRVRASRLTWTISVEGRSDNTVLPAANVLCIARAVLSVSNVHRSFVATMPTLVPIRPPKRHASVS